MRKVLVVTAVFAGLAACSPPVPDSAKGVGFEDYDTYLARVRAQEAQRNAPPPTVQPQPVTTAAPGVPPQTEAQQIAAQARAAVQPQSQASASTAAVPAPAVTAAGNPSTATTTRVAAVDPNNPDISDEQDFNAVSSRRTIEDDAARVQEKRAQYAVVKPTALPSRPGGASLTPIQFALSTNHPVGQRVYRRGLSGARKAQAECIKYDSVEKAQDVFLRNGGPEKDKLGMDPDGDGYACGWNPAVHRGLVRRGG